MATSLKVKKFHESHPWPDKCGIDSLFRFYKIDLGRVDRLRHLFTELKLYHSLPSNFNDPFECKPHFSLPKEAKKIRKIRQHILKNLRERGHNKKEAEKLASKIMENPERLEEIILASIQETSAQVRICSFTKRKENLLFWSHYADSHKGFCVEFDATKMPISYAFKVQYSNEYPEAVYPSSNDVTDLIPLLVKSEVWNYEEEFRTILVPWAEPQPDNDGESLILRGDEIKNVYLGSNIDKNKKEQLIDLVKQGSFNPGIWTTNLAKSTFSLDFDQVG